MEQLNTGQVKKHIKQLKQRQDQYLYYLGQLAFQAGEQGTLQDAAMLEAYRTLKEIQAQVASHEAALQQAKLAREAAQSPRCPRCGAPLQRGASFCAACGASLAAPVPVAAQRTCPQCGSPLSADAVFCPNCGARSAGAAYAQAEPAPPLAETHACPKCGADTPAGMAFCATCAAGEGTAPAAAEPAPPLEETHACPKCGAGVLDKDAVFCAVCGTKVRQ